MQNFATWLENRDVEMIKYMKDDEMPDWLYRARGEAIQKMKEKKSMNKDGELSGDQHKLDVDKDGTITSRDLALLRGQQQMKNKKMMSKDGDLIGNQHKLDVDGDGKITGQDFAKLRARKNESSNNSYEIFSAIRDELQNLRPDWDINVSFGRFGNTLGLGPQKKFEVEVPLDGKVPPKIVAKNLLSNMLAMGADKYVKPDYKAIYAQYEKERRDPGSPSYVGRGGWTGD